MKRILLSVFGFLALAMATLTPAFAQSAATPLTPTFVSVSVGVQPQKRNEEGIVSFPLYDENAVLGIGLNLQCHTKILLS